MFLYVPLVTVSGLVHYRLLRNRSVTWRWLLVLSAMDLVLITASIILQRGFERFLFLAYYPVLAPFVLLFLSLLSRAALMPVGRSWSICPMRGCRF